MRMIVANLTLCCLLASGLEVSGGEISAYVEPYRDIDVASSELGTVAYLNVREGDRVSAGQLLAGLDETVLVATLEVARLAKESIGRLASVEAELNLQVERLEKIELLVERGHASVEELARSKSQVEVAKAQVTSVREELAMKCAELNRIEAQIDQKRIKSPIDGVVTRVFKDAGEFVSASDPTVIKVVQLDKLKAEFSVPAGACEFTQGQNVTLSVGKDRLQSRGLVEFVSPTTDAQSNTVRVTIRLDNSRGSIRSGDSCWLAIADLPETTPPSIKFTGTSKNK
ncbi:MAG: efflux RND transporter periplasmic adaptor subunit [Planctomycetales bacterium]|nr:efflux RND transporter periplasmic adaptor subunit [Planctomycetales bacterium]